MMSLPFYWLSVKPGIFISSVGVVHSAAVAEDLITEGVIL
jgi:hypothetical protein